MTKFKLSAEINGYRQRIGTYDTMPEAITAKTEIQRKCPYSKPKIVSVYAEKCPICKTPMQPRHNSSKGNIRCPKCGNWEYARIA